MDIAMGAVSAVIFMMLMQGAWLIVNDRQREFTQRKYKNEIKSKEL